MLMIPVYGSFAVKGNKKYTPKIALMFFKTLSCKLKIRVVFGRQIYFCQLNDL